MASQHAHAPWRKTVLIPFWTIQLGFTLAFIALLAVAMGVLVAWKQTDNNMADFMDQDSDNAVTVAYQKCVLLNSPAMIWADISAFSRVIPIYITVCAICLILTVTEIILLARHKLKPMAFVIMNVVKSAVFTALLVLDIISLVSVRTTSPVSNIPIDAILL